LQFLHESKWILWQFEVLLLFFYNHRPWQILQYHLFQLLRYHRFGQEIIKAFLKITLPISHYGIGSEHNNGNTLAKIANGITDTAVCMAAKAHLRSDRPLVISLASNDALSANLRNIATLLSRKQVYFVPMVQDDPEKKPHSLVADFSLLMPTLQDAFRGKQFRKLFL
jgi:hypothetical protein